MDFLFLEGEWAEYLDSVASLLESKDGAEIGSERMIGLELNRGHAELKLGLGRKAVASAERALNASPASLSLSLKAFSGAASVACVRTCFWRGLRACVVA